MQHNPNANKEERRCKQAGGNYRATPQVGDGPDSSARHTQGNQHRRNGQPIQKPAQAIAWG